MSHSRFMKLDTTFWHDYRMVRLSPEQKIAYLGFATLAVHEGTEVLTPQQSDPRYVAHWCHVRPRSVSSLLQLCCTMDAPLLQVGSTGAVTVCGTAKRHPNLVQKSVLREEEEEEEEEDKEEEEERLAPQGEPQSGSFSFGSLALLVIKTWGRKLSARELQDLKQLGDRYGYSVRYWTDAIAAVKVAGKQDMSYLAGCCKGIFAKAESEETKRLRQKEEDDATDALFRT